MLSTMSRKMMLILCLDSALHALRQQFLHVNKLITGSDNAKNLAGKQSVSCIMCAWLQLFKTIAYYHNEVHVQRGNNVCDTHFSHQQTQVEAYLVQGKKWRKKRIYVQAACCCTNGETPQQQCCFVSVTPHIDPRS